MTEPLTEDEAIVTELAELLFSCKASGYDEGRDAASPSGALAPPSLTQHLPPVVFHRGAWIAFARAQLRRLRNAGGVHGATSSSTR